MKSRLQRVLDALAGTKDDAELRRVLDKARDEEEEAEKTREKKERDEAEAKEKEIEAKDEEFKKEVRDSISKLTDAVGRLVKDKAKDEEEEEAKGKKKEEDEDEDEMEEETGSADAGKARDSALLEDSFNDIKAKAEIIAPGIQMPSFDAKADPKKTFRDCHCGLRRKALQQATQDAETAEIVKTVRGRALDSGEILKMSCGQVRTIFNGVAAMKANRNNGRLTVDAAQTQNKTQDNVSPMEKFKAASKARWSDKK